MLRTGVEWIEYSTTAGLLKSQTCRRGQSELLSKSIVQTQHRRTRLKQVVGSKDEEDV